MSTLRFASAVTSIAIAASLAQVVPPSTHAQPAPAATGADRSATPAPAERIKQLIAQLSNDDFRQRIKAQNELVSLGDLAEPQLLERLKQNPDPETRSLIEAALASIARTRELGPTLVTLKLKDAAPHDAFAALAERAGLKISPGADNLLNALRDERVTAHLERVPFWEALLKISSQSGVAITSIDAGGHIALEMLPTEGAAAPPAATAGPFLVTIGRLDCRGKWVAFAGQRPFNAPLHIPVNPNPPCRLFLVAWSEPRLNAVRWFIDSIDECTTDTGHDMRDAALPQDIGGGASGTVNGPMHAIYTLAAPDPKAERIARLAITASFVLHKQIQTLEVPDVLTVKNATHWLGGFRLVIKEVDKVDDDQYACTLSLHRDNRSPAEWDQFRALLDQYPCYLLDADGNALFGNGGGSNSGPNEIDMKHAFTTEPRRGGAIGAPAKLIWRFPEEMREVKVPLLFRDVPLPQVRGAGVSFRTTTPRETTSRASCEVVSVKLRTFVDDCSAGTSPASTPSPTPQAWRQPLFPSVSICGSPSPSDACANKNPQPLVRGTGGSHSNRRH